jgi:N-acyl-D-aspartate/D-glutamate deacylase
MDSWPDIAVNTVMQVGHNTLRLMAMGLENRAPREAELRHMQDMLAEELQAGALGLSSGLFTAPGSFSERDELRALGRVLKAHGARYGPAAQAAGNGAGVRWGRVSQSARTSLAAFTCLVAQCKTEHRS